ncbi:hypothetical protein [uncultured Draconibacterium sp.]|uniref:hypothetical protein n=1 Tax=uncultured Draconibacterium sp. TaxID=1573823 RepID=UPI0029C673BB|nr:hypothetical protein [uncultured Draconibacterium sp.]
MDPKSIIFLIAAIVFLSMFLWLFTEKSEYEVFKKLKLFPRWIKIIGIVIVLLSATIPFYVNLLIEGKNYLGLTVVNLGLFLICFSRDKQEDEMSNLIRLKSFYRSTVLGFAYVFIFTAIEFIHGDEFELVPAIQVITFMLLMYLLNYYVTKSKIRSAE